MAYEAGLPFDYRFVFSNISPKVPLEIVLLLNVFLVIMKCLLDRQFAGGEKQYFRCRHAHADTYTLQDAHRWEPMNRIYAYSEVMELSFLASLPESSQGVVVHWTGNCSFSTQTEVGGVWVCLSSIRIYCLEYTYMHPLFLNIS